MKTILKGLGCFILAFGVFFGLMISIAMGSALGRMFYDEYKNEIPNTEKTDINAVTRGTIGGSKEYWQLGDNQVFNFNDKQYIMLPYTVIAGTSSYAQFDMYQFGIGIFQGEDGLYYYRNELLIYGRGLFSGLGGGDGYITAPLTSPTSGSVSLSWTAVSGSMFPANTRPVTYTYSPNTGSTANQDWQNAYRVAGTDNTSIYDITILTLSSTITFRLGSAIEVTIQRSGYAVYYVPFPYATNQTTTSINMLLNLSSGVYSPEEYNKYGETMYQQGKEFGYQSGFDEATKQNTNLWGFLISVAEVPVNMIQDMLNFEILGVNMADFVLAVFTACLVVVVLKIFV
jgi:hypothetical protein